jgi:hypothetical protein
MTGSTDLMTVYRSADMNAETDATAVRNLLVKAGLEAVVAGDDTPGVVEGTYEVRVPTEQAAEAEKLIAQVPMDDPGAVNTSHDLDLVTVTRTDGTMAEMQAQAIQSILDASGISAIIVGSSSLPNLGFEVKVASDTLEQARQVIAEAQSAGPAAAAEAEAASEQQQN